MPPLSSVSLIFFVLVLVLPAARPDGYTQVFDNERVRGWKLALDPGQSVAPVTQRRDCALSSVAARSPK